MPSRPRISITFGVNIAIAIAFALNFARAAEEAKSVQNATTDEAIPIVLPAEIFAVAGVESNIYFDNVVLLLNPANFTFDVTCAKGAQQAERWTWTPTEADVGDYAFQLDVRDNQNRLVSTRLTKIKVVAANPDKKKPLSLLLIGDSLTHASITSKHLLDLSIKFSAPELKLVGSHSVEPTLGANRHEGYGGWTAKRFATHYTDNARQGDYSKRGSPFLYKQPDGSTKLDFQHYCSDVNEGKFPDVVTIFLGPNDVFSFNDETIAGGIVSMLSHYDMLIEMIHSVSPSTRLGVMLPVPPAASQDAFGKNYTTKQTRWQYRRNQQALVKAMIERYRDRQEKGIQLISTHANLDCVHNYPDETVLSNSESEVKIVRQSNGVHPAATGYRQIGDTVYAWLMSIN